MEKILGVNLGTNSIGLTLREDDTLILHSKKTNHETHTTKNSFNKN